MFPVVHNDLSSLFDAVRRGDLGNVQRLVAEGQT
jgi:hypothetical protein